MIDVWLSQDEFGKGKLRDEYSGTIVYVIDNIIKIIEKEAGQDKHNILPST